MTAGIDAALALLVAQHETTATVNNSAMTAVRVKREPKVKATKPETFDNVAATAIAPIVAKGENAPDLSGNQVRLLHAPAVLPAKGTIGPRGFLKLLASAKDQESKVQAIAMYVGYNRGDLFGSQELNARMTATREIRQENGQTVKVDPSTPYYRNGHGAATVAGYVAGMPDMDQKRLDNFQAHEKLIVDRIVELTDQGKLLIGDEKTTNDGMIAIERARLTQVRKDIASLVR